MKKSVCLFLFLSSLSLYAQRPSDHRSFGISRSTPTDMYAQSASSSSSVASPGPPYVTNPYTLAFASVATKGNSIIAVVNWDNGAGVGSIAVTDSAGNTYTQLVLATGLEVWYSPGISAPGSPITISVTYSGTGGVDLINLAVLEYTGLISTPLDASNYATAAVPAVAHASITTGFTQEMVIAIATSPTDLVGLATGFANPNYSLRESTAATTGTVGTLLTFDLFTGLPSGTTFDLWTRAAASHVSAALVSFRLKLTPAAPGSSWLLIDEPASVNPSNPGFTDRSAFLYFGKGKARHSLTNTLQQRGTATVPLYFGPTNTYDATLIQGAQVYLYDITPGPTSTLVFAGNISKVQSEPLGLGGARIVTLTVLSFRRQFDKLRVRPQLFQYQTAGDIFTSLFQSVAAGVPLALGAIVGSGSGSSGTGANFVINSLDLTASPWPRLSSVFDDIARASGCIWDIDLATLTVFLKPPSTTAAPYTVNSKQVLYDSVTWEENDADYRNWQSIQISNQAFGDFQESFPINIPGGGAQFSVTMKAPVTQVTAAWATKNQINSATGTFSGLPANGDTVSIAYPQTGSIYNWAPDAPYAKGQTIIDPANHIQIVTVQGTSGASQPAWNDTGGTTTDGPGASPKPGFGGAVIWQDLGVSGPGGLGASVYTFVNVLDNTQWGQVLIDPTGNVVQTCQNLVDAINANSIVQGGISGSPTFSAPTWASPLVNASGNGTTTLTVTNKVPGQGYFSALSKTGSAFSWSGAVTTGGSTTFGTVNLSVTAYGSGNNQNIYYTPGSPVVGVFISGSGQPNSFQGTGYLSIAYQAAGQSIIIVENTPQVLARALIENGNGLHMQSIDQSSLTSNTQALQFVQAVLEAYDSVPVSWSFQDFPPGLLPGQLLTVSITGPSYLAALLNGTWFVQEVTAELIPIGQPMTGPAPARWLNQTTAPGAGHYRYTVTLINETQILSWLAFWEQMAGGGGGGGSSSLIAGAAPSGFGGNGSPPTFSGMYVMGTSGNLIPDGVSYIQQTGSGGVAGPLTGTATIKPPATINVGNTFKVQLIQPVAGSGYNVTWDAIYKGMGTFGLDTTAGTQAVLEFLVMTLTDIQLMDVPQNGWPNT